MEDLRYKAYEWPVVGALLEKVYPAPHVTMGVMRAP
jgi:hypothetical protein